MSLKAALVLLILAFLVLLPLTAPGFVETRPYGSINWLGYVSFALQLATLVLDALALYFLWRGQVRRAALLAVVGFVVFVAPFIGDLFNVFSSLPAPAAVLGIEVAAFAAQVGILIVGISLLRRPDTG